MCTTLSCLVGSTINSESFGAAEGTQCSTGKVFKF